MIAASALYNGSSLTRYVPADLNIKSEKKQYQNNNPDIERGSKSEETFQGLDGKRICQFADLSICQLYMIAYCLPACRHAAYFES